MIQSRINAGALRAGCAPFRRFAVIATLLTLALVIHAARGSAYEIKRAGKLKVPRDAPLAIFSTDPTIHQVLSEDIFAAHRAAGPDAHSVLTVTVNVSQHPLKPGVSLNDLAPGDPQVADLIKAAGATPPPVGDTGSDYDTAAYARQMATRNILPGETPMQRMIQQFSGGEMGPPLPCESRSVVTPGCPPPAPEIPRPQSNNPGYTGDTEEYMRQGTSLSRFLGHNDDRGYDVVVVARATVSGAPEEMTLVSVIHPGEDAHDVKKLMAEKIADAVLH